MLIGLENVILRLHKKYNLFFLTAKKMQSRLAAKVDQKTICCRISNVRCTKMKVELLNRGWEGIYLKSQAAKNVFRCFLKEQVTFFRLVLLKELFVCLLQTPSRVEIPTSIALRCGEKKWNFWLYLDPSENIMQLLSLKNVTTRTPFTLRSDSLANIFMSECPPKWWLIHAGLKRKLCVKFRFVIEEVIHRSRITSHQINGMARKKAALRRLFISAFVSQPKNLALLLIFGIR